MAKIKKEYTCSLLLGHDLLGGKWKQRVLWHIINGNNRFSLLQKNITDITHKVLVEQLNELVQTGILTKVNVDDVRLHVTYQISEPYQSLVPIINAMSEFTNHYARLNDINVPDCALND